MPFLSTFAILLVISCFSEVKRKRRDFEYKLKAVTKDLSCFLSYIEYEEQLLKTIRTKREKFKVNDKKGSIEYRIIAKIKKLYDDALRFAPDNYELCVDYFMFCKKVRHIEPATAAVDRLLKVNMGFSSRLCDAIFYVYLFSCILVRNKRGIWQRRGTQRDKKITNTPWKYC